MHEKKEREPKYMSLFFSRNKKPYRKPVHGLIPINEGINHSADTSKSICIYTIYYIMCVHTYNSSEGTSENIVCELITSFGVSEVGAQVTSSFLAIGVVPHEFLVKYAKFLTDWLQ